MSILAFNKATTMSDYMDNVAKQHEKKLIFMTATREKKRKKQKITTFSTKWALLRNKTKKQNARKTASHQTTKHKTEKATQKKKRDERLQSMKVHKRGNTGIWHRRSGKAFRAFSKNNSKKNATINDDTKVVEAEQKEHFYHFHQRQGKATQLQHLNSNDKDKHLWQDGKKKYEESN